MVHTSDFKVGDIVKVFSKCLDIEMQERAVGKEITATVVCLEGSNTVVLEDFRLNGELYIRPYCSAIYGDKRQSVFVGDVTKTEDFANSTELKVGDTVKVLQDFIDHLDEDLELAAQDKVLTAVVHRFSSSYIILKHFRVDGDLYKGEYMSLLEGAGFQALLSEHVEKV